MQLAQHGTLPLSADELRGDLDADFRLTTEGERLLERRLRERAEQQQADAGPSTSTSGAAAGERHDSWQAYFQVRVKVRWTLVCF